VRDELAATPRAVAKSVDFAVNGNYAGAIKKAHQAAVDVTANAMSGDVTATAQVTEAVLGALAGRAAKGGPGRVGSAATKPGAPSATPKTAAPKPPAAADAPQRGKVTAEGSGKATEGRQAPNTKKTADTDKQQRVRCKSCFVAGTLVAVNGGFKPIEEIRVRDLVLSKDEITFEVAYKPVTHLILTEGKGVYDLSIRNVKGELEVITVMDNHPF